MNFITPEIRHHFGGGVYAKETFIPEGKWLVQHTHKFDHLSILAQGSIELIVDGVTSIIHAPACLTIAANKHHGVRSLTNVIWYCVHATDCTDEDTIDEVIISDIDPQQLREITHCLSKGA
jgi:mannose-6-phosphate isomerase-like protein (cupin superfamily)